MPPITPGRLALSTPGFISPTALSPASMETPAAAYASGFGVPAEAGAKRAPSWGGLLNCGLLRVVEDGQRLGVRRLEQVLAEQGLVGQVDGVPAREARGTQPAG